MVGYWNHSNNSITNKGAPPFVTPTSHSMLHRTLLPSSLFSAAPLRPSPPPSLRPQQQPEVTMETSALKRDRRPESAAPPSSGEETGFFLPDDAAWAVEEFLVDDLLDFDGLEDSGETFEANPTSPAAAAAAAAAPVPPPPLADINLPTHDAEEFEWMSSIIDDTLPEYPAAAAHAVAASQPKTRLSPPPPQPPLEALCRFPTSSHVLAKAKRSKRARSAGGAWPRFGGAAASVAALSDYSSASTTTTTTNNNNSSSSSCSSSPTYNSNAIILYPPPPPQPRKRGRKPKLPPPPPPYWAAARGGGEVARGFGERRCTHCGSQKTPQWRTGPAGPKTLCNACGVRYKSGRLVPEYRPAASPTFVSHVHSNSHRKVLEMRRSKAERHHLAVAPPVSSF